MLYNTYKSKCCLSTLKYTAIYHAKEHAIGIFGSRGNAINRLLEIS